MKNINKKIYVFYHIFLYDKINEIIKEQLDRLIKSELIHNCELRVIILDNFNKTYELDQYNLNILNKYSKDIFYFNENLYEMITHKKIYDHALLNYGNYLYMHTKGCTRINDKDNNNNNNNGYSYKNVENWRRMQEHFTIDHWRLCNNRLDEFDVVGSNYFKKNHLPGIGAHYSGGFWWATSNFISKLPDPQNYLNQKTMDRFNAEFWIGRIKHKALCLYPLPEKIEDHNRCYVYTDEKDYFNNIIENKYEN